MSENEREKVLTPEAQANHTPETVVEWLRQGNARFVSGELQPKDLRAQATKLVNGQYPLAMVLSCIDSRLPIESIFDCGVGDMFVARVGGNFVNPDILGSMEFACKVTGSKVVLVLGHQHCGAVMNAIDGVELGNITHMLASIAPAIEGTPGFEADRTSGNPEFVAAVTEANIRHAIEVVRSDSPILAEMEANGEISIVGAVYSFEEGTVTFLP